MQVRLVRQSGIRESKESQVDRIRRGQHADLIGSLVLSTGKLRLDQADGLQIVYDSLDQHIRGVPGPDHKISLWQSTQAIS